MLTVPGVHSRVDRQAHVCDVCRHHAYVHGTLNAVAYLTFSDEKLPAQEARTLRLIPENGDPFVIEEVVTIWIGHVGTCSGRHRRGPSQLAKGPGHLANTWGAFGRA